MNNPFEIIEARLSTIESLILDLKHSGGTQLPNQEDQLLTVDGAAEFLDCTKPTIYQKTSKGELPFMKRGKKLYFMKRDLIDYLKAGRNKTNAEIAASPEDYMVKPKGRRA